MNFAVRTSVLALVAIAAPALAGEEIVYDKAPAWVALADLPPSSEKQGSPFRLFDQQVRLEDGQVWAYLDTAIALDSPQALTSMGTLSANWIPDKGDLIIHAVELIRDGESVDLIAGGAKFDVLRREQGLERRMLDGVFTATMALPGARVGDTVRLRYSTTMSDQALKDNMQWTGGLLAEPMPLAKGRITASWPSASDVHHKVLSQSELGSVEEKGDYTYYSVALPIEKPKDMPYDAPWRYRLPALVQFSSFTEFADVSAAMAPLFATEGALEGSPDIAAQVAQIAAASDDPLARAAMATRLVQDEISYLLNGMNGGNYIPQSIEETWDKRYGDCKAKTLLLLAMLRGLGIESDAVLVQSNFGDAIPQMLPAPGDFDHVIVRAIIDGETYWLDGTSSGTRLSNIADVPRFGFGLPLSEGAGADLVEFTPRALANPVEVVKIEIDQTAGLAVPAIFEIEAKVSGANAAPWKLISQMEEAEQRDNSIDMIAWNLIGQGQVLDRAATFDDETGKVTISLRGLMNTPWNTDDGIYETSIPFQIVSGFGFANDRARKEWREIPVVVNAPYYEERDITWLLPDGDFKLEGKSEIDTDIGGNTIHSAAKLAPGRFDLSQWIRSYVWEIPASELPAAKRESTQLERSLPKLESPKDSRRFWQYRGKDRKLLSEIEEIYAGLIAEAKPDETRDLLNRANFRARTGDYAGALEDYESAIAVKADASLYRKRGEMKYQLGDLEGALEDFETVEDLEAAGRTYYSRIEILGLLGRGDETLALADEYSLVAEEFESAETMRAHALGWAGQAEEGLQVLQDLAIENPQDGNLLNAVCWHAGIWNIVDQGVLDQCTEAVEKGGNSSAKRDSRALAYYRMGMPTEALADLNAVLDSSPDQLDSRYLRGIVRMSMGDKAGKQDVEDALWGTPLLKLTYGAYGLTAK